MHYEFVKVINRKELLDAIQRRHAYSTKDGRGLPRGIHVVQRSPDTITGHYGADLRCHRPFPSWRAAGDFARGTLVSPQSDAVAWRDGAQNSFAAT